MGEAPFEGSPLATGQKTSKQAAAWCGGHILNVALLSPSPLSLPFLGFCRRCSWGGAWYQVPRNGSSFSVAPLAAVDGTRISPECACPLHSCAEGRVHMLGREAGDSRVLLSFLLQSADDGKPSWNATTFPREFPSYYPLVCLRCSPLHWGVGLQSPGAARKRRSRGLRKGRGASWEEDAQGIHTIGIGPLKSNRLNKTPIHQGKNQIKKPQGSGWILTLDTSDWLVAILPPHFFFLFFLFFLA